MTTGRKGRTSKPSARTRSKAASSTRAPSISAPQDEPPVEDIAAPAAEMEAETVMTAAETHPEPSALAAEAEPAAPPAQETALAEPVAEAGPAPEPASQAEPEPAEAPAAPEPAPEPAMAEPVAETAAEAVPEPVAEAPAAEVAAALAPEPEAALRPVAAVSETVQQEAEQVLGAAQAGLAGLAEMNSRVFVFVHGEVIAAFAFWSALREIRNPGDAARLQIAEINRSLAAAMECWNDLTRIAIDRRAA